MRRASFRRTAKRRRASPGARRSRGVLLAALAGTPSALVLRAAAELVDIIALPDTSPDRRALEERVWTLSSRGRPSAPLRALAEKVGLSVAKSQIAPQ